jgi:hypothetical protein
VAKNRECIRRSTNAKIKERRIKEVESHNARLRRTVIWRAPQATMLHLRRKSIDCSILNLLFDIVRLMLSFWDVQQQTKQKGNQTRGEASPAENGVASLIYAGLGARTQPLADPLPTITR